MIAPDQALMTLPDGLRKPLLKEYQDIINNYLENRWQPAELSGGRFCEVVYSILHGRATGSYAAAPSKPRNFVEACRRLENDSDVPRSFQILIPRMLPALYEIRNNRGVGHVGGDVDPNFMDSAAVVSMVSWIMAEMIRVFHEVSTSEAQQLVNSIAERRIPLIWKSGQMRRVLNPRLSLKDQVLLLIGSSSGNVSVDQLLIWTGYSNRSYFNKLMRQLHSQRFIELDDSLKLAELLPPGSDYVSRMLEVAGCR